LRLARCSRDFRERFLPAGVPAQKECPVAQHQQEHHRRNPRRTPKPPRARDALREESHPPPANPGVRRKPTSEDRESRISQEEENQRGIWQSNLPLLPATRCLGHQRTAMLGSAHLPGGHLWRRRPRRGGPKRTARPRGGIRAGTPRRTPRPSFPLYSWRTAWRLRTLYYIHMGAQEPQRAEPHSATGEAQEGVRGPWLRRVSGG
jgi:hypothetical protein